MSGKYGSIPVGGTAAGSVNDPYLAADLAKRNLSIVFHQGATRIFCAKLKATMAAAAIQPVKAVPAVAELTANFGTTAL